MWVSGEVALDELWPYSPMARSLRSARRKEHLAHLCNLWWCGSMQTGQGTPWFDGGVVLTSNDAVGEAVHAQRDGKVVVSASVGGVFTLFRFNADGSPDASFGSGGIQALPIFQAGDRFDRDAGRRKDLWGRYRKNVQDKYRRNGRYDIWIRRPKEYGRCGIGRWEQFIRDPVGR